MDAVLDLLVMGSSLEPLGKRFLLAFFPKATYLTEISRKNLVWSISLRGFERQSSGALTTMTNSHGVYSQQWTALTTIMPCGFKHSGQLILVEGVVQVRRTVFYMSANLLISRTGNEKSITNDSKPGLWDINLVKDRTLNKTDTSSVASPWTPLG